MWRRPGTLYIPVWEEVVSKWKVNCFILPKMSKSRRCIKVKRCAITLFSLLPTLSQMPLSAADNQLAAVYDNGQPISRQSSAGLMASIWAPRPQHSETTWPKTLDSFSRVADKGAQQLSPLEAKNIAFQQSMMAREEFFAQVPPGTQNFPTRDVGAIGDGRKKNSPDYEDSVCAFYLAF
jgi:hypothetical protein